MAKRDEQIQHGPPTEEEVYEALGISRKPTVEPGAFAEERKPDQVLGLVVRIPNWAIPASIVGLYLYPPLVLVLGGRAMQENVTFVACSTYAVAYVPFVLQCLWQKERRRSISWWTCFLPILGPLLVWLAQRRNPH